MSDKLHPDAVIGGYRLLFRLGKGGMGEVWAAALDREQGFQKLVALKIMHSKETASNAAVMFADEAKAAAALQHQCIVPTVDFGRDGETLFLAMEMVQGPSLTALLQRLVINQRRLSPATVAHVGISIASALDYAHERATHEGQLLRLVHRDVSPHNVLLDLNGSVRLTDFGVARTAVQDHESRVGTVRGKPSYMAPEQVQGAAIDARTDVFALGIVLYESACLKRLFGRSNPLKSMEAVLKHDPKPLTELVPDFPHSLWLVLKKALEKAPEKRFESAADFVAALQQESRELPDRTQAPRQLVAAIEQNFEPGAFDVEARIRAANRESERNTGQVASAKTRSAAEAGQMATGRARAKTGEPGEAGEPGGPRGFRELRDPVWPTAQASDPLAPEAIEQLRTRLHVRESSSVGNERVPPRGRPSGFTPTGMTPSGVAPLISTPSSQTPSSSSQAFASSPSSLHVLTTRWTSPAKLAAYALFAALVATGAILLKRSSEVSIVDSVPVPAPLPVPSTASPQVESAVKVRSPANDDPRPAPEASSGPSPSPGAPENEEKDLGESRGEEARSPRDHRRRTARAGENAATGAATNAQETGSPPKPRSESAAKAPRSYGETRAMVLEAKRKQPEEGGRMMAELLELGPGGAPDRIEDLYRRALKVVKGSP